MSIIGYEIAQQQSIAMLHDIDNQLIRLNGIKSSLMSGIADLLQMESSLTPDSPEMKLLEAKRQQLAAYEKRLDMEITQFQNRRKKAEMRLQNATQMVDRNIDRQYRGR